MKRQQVFDVGLEPYCSVSGSMGACVQQSGERKREVMNEGGYKNRKPRGKKREVSRKKRSCFVLL